MLTDENRAYLRALQDLAASRGQQLSQLALAWALRDPRVTSVLVGVSSVAQLEQNVAALDHPGFSPRSWPRSTKGRPPPASTSGATRTRVEPVLG